MPAGGDLRIGEIREVERARSSDMYMCLPSPHSCYFSREGRGSTVCLATVSAVSLLPPSSLAVIDFTSREISETFI